MSFLKSIFDFYINSSIHVALAVYSLVRITENYLGFPYNESFDYVVFLGTITGYNFIKYAGIARLHHLSLTSNLKVIQIFSLICFLLLLYCSSKLSIQTILCFCLFAGVTTLYAVPIFNGFKKNLRDISTLKIWVIALVWAACTVLLPTCDIGKSIDKGVILLFVQRILFVVVLTLPFDIRDLQYDKRKLQTIPQVLGVERAKKLGFILLAISMLIEFWITPNNQFKTVFLIVFLLLLFLLQRSKVKQPKYYASFWVEALPIFWFIVLSVITNK